MKSFIEYIAKELVDNTLDVNVIERIEESVTVYELRVGDGELGKVIGKRGKTANAIRTLVSAISKKNGEKAVLEILE